MKTAGMSSYPIVLTEEFFIILFSYPPTSATFDSTRKLTSLALWSTNHVQDQQIVEQTERGHTLSCSMRGFFRTEERTSVMRMRLTGDHCRQKGSIRTAHCAFLACGGKAAGCLSFVHIPEEP